MKLDLRQLRMVLALDRHRSFARAADELGLTQPALSRNLRVLEETLGARLFDRDRAHVEPTAVGELLIERAAPLLAQARRVERELTEMITVSEGVLRVGAGPFAAELSVGIALGRLARRHPGVSLDLEVADWPVLTERILARDLDLVIAEASLAADDPRLEVELLPSHTAVFFCRVGHPLAGSDDLTIDDIRRYPLVLTSVPERLRDLVDRERSTRFRGLPDGVGATGIRVSALAPGRQIVEYSDAIGVALPRQIEQELQLGRLVALPLRLASLRTAYGVIRLARRSLSPVAAEFVTLLREVEAGIAGPG
jgi:DNA-binding transcriptional LysR family regulator